MLVGGGARDIETHLEAILKANRVEVTKLAVPGMQSSGAHLSRLAELKPGDYDLIAFLHGGAESAAGAGEGAPDLLRIRATVSRPHTGGAAPRNPAHPIAGRAEGEEGAAGAGRNQPG